MNDFKVTDEAVEAAARAVLPSGGTCGEYLLSPNHDGLDGLLRTIIVAALPVMFEQCGWWYETPHGRVVTKTMIGSGSNPLYRLKEPK